MSLRFESVSLKNFGPYREIDALNLQADSDAPIVVIHGENTVGKTTLFRALRWCLYGSLLPQQAPADATRQLVQYLNRPAAAEGENIMEVSMRFIANSQPYNLVRRATFDGASRRITTDLRIGATVVPQAAIDAEIGRLLHPQISEFFLFDGELLRDFYDRLNTDRERDFIRTSIDSVLGIPALQRAERDVAEITEDVLQRQAKALKNANDRESARRKLRELKDKQESVEKDREEIQAALRNVEAQMKDLKERIAAVAELQADAREQETLESQIEGAKREEAKVREDLQKLLATGWLAPAAAKLTKVLEQVQARNNASQQQQRTLQAARDRVEVLQKQMQGGVCMTCHQHLPPPDESTRRELEEADRQLVKIRANAGDGPDLMFERRIGFLIDRSTTERYREKQEQLNGIFAAQFSRNRRLATLKDRLKDSNAAAIRALGDEQERLDAVIDRYEQQLKTFKPKLDDISAQQNREAKVLTRLSGGQPALAAESVFYEYARTLLAGTIERYQERTRQEVEKTASEMFVNLVRDSQGYQGLRIGRDYRVDLLGHRGEPIVTSEGGKLLVALSLIGALKQAAVRGGPVVLDSPLARLDLDHRANVLQKWVPSLGSQSVLLVQSGELTEHQSRDVMGSRIGREYRIYRPNNDPDEAQIERTR
jgi:DNA sulfur modification protein DndD